MKPKLKQSPSLEDLDRFRILPEDLEFERLTCLWQIGDTSRFLALLDRLERLSYSKSHLSSKLLYIEFRLGRLKQAEALVDRALERKNDINAY